MVQVVQSLVRQLARIARSTVWKIASFRRKSGQSTESVLVPSVFSRREEIRSDRQDLSLCLCPNKDTVIDLKDAQEHQVTPPIAYKWPYCVTKTRWPKHSSL